MNNIQSPFSKIIHETASKHYNVADEYKHNTVDQNKDVCKMDRLPYAIGALSITGDLNIGIMIRTSVLLGASDFFIFGRKKYDKRSTVGAQNYINIHNYDSSILSINEVIESFGYNPVLIEQGGTSLPLSRNEWHDMVKKPLFLFGSESHGIPNDITTELFNNGAPILSIPQHGVLRSYNVSTAMSIISWEYRRNFYAY